MEFTSRSKINHTPIDKPIKFQIILPQSDLERLRSNAAKNSTTVSEIVRVLVSEYLKSLDDKPKER